MIKVVIADDSLSVRNGIRSILEGAPDMFVVDEASNGQEAIELVEKHFPDVVILDVQMPVMDGITAMKILRQRGWKMPILILSGTDDHLHTIENLGFGAHSYVLKEDAPEFLAGAVQRAYQGLDGKNSPGVRRKYNTLPDLQ